MFWDSRIFSALWISPLEKVNVCKLTKWLKTGIYSSILVTVYDVSAFLVMEIFQWTKRKPEKFCFHKAYVVIGQAFIHDKCCIRGYEVLWKANMVMDGVGVSRVSWGSSSFFL